MLEEHGRPVEVLGAAGAARGDDLIRPPAPCLVGASNPSPVDRFRPSAAFGLILLEEPL